MAGLLGLGMFCNFAIFPVKKKKEILPHDQELVNANGLHENGGNGVVVVDGDYPVTVHT